MILFIEIVTVIFIAAGCVMLFGITPAVVEEGFMDLFIKKRIVDEVETAENRGTFLQRNFKKFGKHLEELKAALESTHRKGYFSYACFVSVFLIIVGIIIGGLLDNWALGVVLGLIFCIIPFQYLEHIIQTYHNHMNDELEMSLNIITMSYVRSENIVSAVDETLPNLRSPVKEIFEDFSTQIHFVDPNIRKAILRLKKQVDNAIFDEWCDNLIMCQDDTDQIGYLLNIVNKYADQKLVNQKLNTILNAPKLEFKIMAMFMVANLGLLYLIQQFMDFGEGPGWFEILFVTTGGKAVLVLDAVIFFIALLRAIKVTKPIEYEN